MNFKRILFVFIPFVIAVFFITVPRPASPPPVIQNETFSITQVIDFGGYVENRQQQFAVHANETALQLIQRTAQVEVKEYSFGSLVESIDGIKNGADNKNWIYSVNGQDATVGASEYLLKPSDLITWSFETYEE